MDTFKWFIHLYTSLLETTNINHMNVNHSDDMWMSLFFRSGYVWFIKMCNNKYTVSKFPSNFAWKCTPLVVMCPSNKKNKTSRSLCWIVSRYRQDVWSYYEAHMGQRHLINEKMWCVIIQMCLLVPWLGEVLHFVDGNILVKKVEK